MSKRIALFAAKAAMAILTVLFAIRFLVDYYNFTAEREASKFCNEIHLGDDISSAIGRFTSNGGKLHYAWSDKTGHTFIFPGSVMDKAYCDVWMDRSSKIGAKRAFLLLD